MCFLLFSMVISPSHQLFGGIESGYNKLKDVVGTLPSSITQIENTLPGIGELGSALQEKIGDIGSAIPAKIGEIGVALDGLFADDNPDDVKFEFSPEPG